MRSKYLETNSGSFFKEEPTITSQEIDVTSSGDTTAAVYVPAGSYVTRCALLATATVAGGDIDLGDGDTADRFLDGVTTIAINDIVQSGLGSAVGADPRTGHYYSSADSIDVTTNASATTGSVKVLVWYYN